MKKRYLIATAFAFAAGAISARFVEPSRLLAPMLSQSHSGPKPASAGGKPAAPPAVPHAAQEQRRPERENAPESPELATRNEQPTLLRKSHARDNSPDVALARQHDLELEDEIQKLLHDPAPQGKVLTRATGEDGTLMTHEQSEDGTTVDRAAFPTGEPKGENWVLPTGEQIQRAYYQSGQVEGLSWAQPDGTTIVVKLAPNGFLQGQREELPNGEKLVTKYDDEGQVAEKWHVRSDGSRVRIL